MSLKETILAAPDLKEKRREVPEWGVTILLKAMDGTARATLFNAMSGKEGAEAGFAALACIPSVIWRCLYDPETRKRIFTQADVEALAEKSPMVLQDLLSESAEMSGLTVGALKEAKTD